MHLKSKISFLNHRTFTGEEGGGGGGGKTKGGIHPPCLFTVGEGGVERGITLLVRRIV